MRIRTRIGQVARERGTTPAAVARRLHLHRSNLSAMDAGRRAVSLTALSRLAAALHCSPGELLEASDDAPVFRRSMLNARLHTRDAGLADGSERGWTHRVLLAWQRHYRARP